MFPMVSEHRLCSQVNFRGHGLNLTGLPVHGITSDRCTRKGLAYQSCFSINWVTLLAQIHISAKNRELVVRHLFFNALKKIISGSPRQSLPCNMHEVCIGGSYPRGSSGLHHGAQKKITNSSDMSVAHIYLPERQALKESF